MKCSTSKFTNDYGHKVKRFHFLIICNIYSMTLNLLIPLLPWIVCVFSPWAKSTQRNNWTMLFGLAKLTTNWCHESSIRSFFPLYFEILWFRSSRVIDIHVVRLMWLFFLVHPLFANHLNNLNFSLSYTAIKKILACRNCIWHFIDCIPRSFTSFRLHQNFCMVAEQNGCCIGVCSVSRTQKLNRIEFSLKKMCFVIVWNTCF